jgi:hypothetical protein
MMTKGGEISMSADTATLELTVSDTSRQKIRRVEDVPADITASELVQGLIDELQVPRNDAAGRSLSYTALLRREARHLGANERVGDNLTTGDWLVLHPRVDAG